MQTRTLLIPRNRTTLNLLLLLLPVLITGFLSAQPSPTPAETRFQGFQQRNSLKNNSLLTSLSPQNIGPSIFSCRVTDVDVNPADPTEFYVAYASGGLWHTTSNGTRFEPVFDHEASMTIGDIAVDWNRKVIWVGTGEANSSRSSYAGTGIYRSADGGKTWEYRGLPESHHIARILLDPDDPNTLWVAVLGHLYSPNAERGIFKTTDGGKTWEKTLFVNDNSGAIDLVADPGDASTLYAATWERSRRAWNFNGAGAGSGIWKSTDKGNTWQQLNVAESGFPYGEHTGRIGLAAGKKNGKTILYACVDNQVPNAKKEKPKTEDLTRDQLRTISVEDFLKLPDEKLDSYLKTNDFPEKYKASDVKSMVEKGKIKPIALVEYLEDANSQLFETDYAGAQLYRSEDGGKTWKLTHDGALEQMFFTYGYYFANVRCMPEDADQVYLIGFLIIRSEDGGKTWKNINGDNVHVDHHALWLNPARPGHLINGNDGGVNISWDNGASWTKCNNPPVGQFYAITTDNASPYNVYGGAQDNGVWYGPSDYEASDSWLQNGQYPYKEVMSGDGMQVQVDTRDNNTLYTGFQFGNYFRVDKNTGATVPITPKHDLGERPLRFNWQTPILLSRHQQDVLYFGANKLYRSFDQGKHWEAISGDLTGGGRPGNVPYGTITTIDESPLKFGLLYVGTDDGIIQVTRDGGETWTKISAALPQDLWVSRVQASAHERARVYASLNGYRWDDFTSYVYVSEDYGNSWQRIGIDLPAEPVNVIREDPANPDVLYVGTDHNVYVSLDRGQHFQTLDKGFPDVPVHDLVVQQTAQELLIGTHGRSIFKADLTQIQEITPEVRQESVHLFKISPVNYNRNWGRKEPYKPAEDPMKPVWFFTPAAGTVKWTLKQKDSDFVLNEGTIESVQGLNKLEYHLDIQDSAEKKYRESLQSKQKDPKKPFDLSKADTVKIYLRKGTYTFALEKDGKKVQTEFTVDSRRD